MHAGNASADRIADRGRRSKPDRQRGLLWVVAQRARFGAFAAKVQAMMLAVMKKMVRMREGPLAGTKRQRRAPRQ
eukprot:4328326-Alexandrium_andersonii.AAC.1